MPGTRGAMPAAGYHAPVLRVCRAGGASALRRADAHCQHYGRQPPRQGTYSAGRAADALTAVLHAAHRLHCTAS
jgi:hypothetical protein